MGYGGKVEEQHRARELRAEAWTLAEIAAELGVSKASVSVWVRDVEFEPRPRNRGHRDQRPHPLTLKKAAELERCRSEAEKWAESLTERDLFIFGLALYLGEGAKTAESGFRFANTSPAIMATFMRWLRTSFAIDEDRLWARLYLHEGLDETAATAYWSELLDIPLDRFHRTYRAAHRGDFKRSRHEMGCVTVGCNDVSLFRRVMALNAAITSRLADPG